MPPGDATFAPFEPIILTIITSCYVVITLILQMGAFTHPISTYMFMYIEWIHSLLPMTTTMMMSRAGQGKELLEAADILRVWEASMISPEWARKVSGVAPSAPGWTIKLKWWWRRSKGKASRPGSICKNIYLEPSSGDDFLQTCMQCIFEPDSVFRFRLAEIGELYELVSQE